MGYKIYTDGGITFATKVGSYALVIIDPEGKVIEAYGKLVENTTSNAMEMRGVLNALRWAARYPDRQVEIITDSQYTQKGTTQWTKGWKRHGWTKQGGVILNLDLWKRIEKLYSRNRNVKVSWIKGHAGYEFNELADQICTRVKNSQPWTDLLKPYRTFESIYDIQSCLLDSDIHLSTTVVREANDKNLYLDSRTLDK